MIGARRSNCDLSKADFYLRKLGRGGASVKTLEAARKLACENVGKVPVVVLCADGVYYLDQTLVLSAGDGAVRRHRWFTRWSMRARRCRD